MSGFTFGLLIFGIDGMAHGHRPLVIVAELGGAACWVGCSSGARPGLPIP